MLVFSVHTSVSFRQYLEYSNDILANILSKSLQLVEMTAYNIQLLKSHLSDPLIYYLSQNMENQLSQFDNVSVQKKANIYFDGKCISHTVLFSDGKRKTIGVFLPSTLTFNTGAPEIMEINGGKCRVRLKGESEWKQYTEGMQFSVPGNSSFEVEIIEPVDYVCHFE